MRRCLHLAMRAKGFTSPNPLVGSVIVHSGKVIGEGFHRQYGGPHAEVHAINSVKNQSLLSESTLYVNLEPCSHWGKTPPCTDLIIEKKIPRVVIGSIDSSDKVCGQGVLKLKEAGIDVTLGVLEQESKFLNRRFFVFNQKKRPYIILKWAETLDGYIDTNRTTIQSGSPTWITNDYSRILVHRWRSEEDAILVGARTVLLDNPQLNIRYYAGNNPTRIIIDHYGNFPETLNVFTPDQPTIVFSPKPERYREFPCKAFPLIPLTEMLDILHSLNIQSIIVEGGSKTLNEFIDKNLFDEIRRFIGGKTFGSGVSAPQISAPPQLTLRISTSHLLFYFNGTESFFQDLI